MLDGGWHASCIELSAKIRKTRSEVPQRLDLTVVEWELAAHEIRITWRQRSGTHVGHPDCEVFVSMHRLPALEFGIPG